MAPPRFSVARFFQKYVVKPLALCGADAHREYPFCRIDDHGWVFNGAAIGS